jgi:hypothetical protein
MATMDSVSVLDSPQVKRVLASDQALIASLEKRVEALQAESQSAHLKATHRRMAIKGLERRAEHLEHLLAASRGDTERLNKAKLAVRTLLKMCGEDAFAAFDALLQYAFGGRVDELCGHIAELDTTVCEAGCGEWTDDVIHYDNEGVPLCRACWAELTCESEEG